MREILFRGQLRRKGEKVNMAGEPLPSIWKYGGVSQYGGGAMIYQAEPKIEKFPVYGDTVGQYTGLRDKNGERIFEGDILCIKKRNGTKSRICFVCFGEYIDADSAFDNYRCIGFYIKIFDTCCTIGVLWDSEFEYEIIGNIHDNPELLERED